MAILKIDKLSKSFGGLMAVSNVSMSLEPGELVGLIGPNGAGKTTVFNLLTGIYVPSSGTITLYRDGREIKLQGKKPHNICKNGIARTFQNIRLFRDLTVIDNVRIAMHKNVGYGFLSGIFHLPSYHKEEKMLTEKCMELLNIFKLDHKRTNTQGTCLTGNSATLEIARALATDPILLLLDEPAAGMNPAETSQLTELICWIREKFNLTILLIEHDMSLVMKICERIYVLDYGMAIAEGTPDEIRSDRRVIEAYLGRLQMMLEIRDLEVHFGVIRALKGISLEVRDGEIVTLLGANGAGKTTTLRTASGLKKPTSGSVLFEGRDITGTTAIERVHMGISHVPEGRRVFSTMTVLENLELGAYHRKDRNGISRDLMKVYELFPILYDRRKQAAGTLSGGEQQMLAIGRALMSRPRLLLLDEPSMGLAPILVQEIFSIITDINREGTTILLVEQNASMALQIANRAYVMETGSIVLTGTGSELMQSEEIKKAYLGG